MEAQEGKRKATKKTLTGRVVSNKMQKTIVVVIERRVLHPLYKKYVTRSKKIKAHDEEGGAKIGDLVRIRQTEAGWQLSQLPAISGALVALDPADGAIRLPE